MAFWLVVVSARIAFADPPPEQVHIDITRPYNTASGELFEQLIQQKQQDFQRSIHRLGEVADNHSLDTPYNALIILGDDALNRINRWPTGYDVIIALHVSPGLFSEKQRTLASPGKTRITALFSGSPTMRQVRLAQLVMPRAHTWLVPYQESQQAALDSLLYQAPSTMHLAPHAWGAEPEPLKGLQPSLRKADAVLALSNLGAITPESVRSILLSAYRQGKPVIGMDAAYVRAGVLAATDTSVEQYELETENILRDWLVNDRLPAPGYPGSFSVHINQRVAQSLNLVLPDEQALTDSLLEQEKSP